MITAHHNIFGRRYGASLDADAVAFLTATGITDLTITNAVNQLVLDFKASGLWTKMEAIYPIVGGTAFTHKWNLKDPRDLNAAFRLTFITGSVPATHSANGIQGTTTAWVDTHLNPRTDLTLNNTHISNYCRTNTATAVVDIGCNDGVSSYNLFQRFFNTYYSDSYNAGANRNSIANTDARGFYSTSRSSATLLKMYKNGSSVLTSTSLQTSLLPNTNMFLMSFDASQYRSDREYAFFTIGDGLDDTEETNLYNSIQTFQTTLGRQI
jgi:hypothetical protein